SDLAPGHRVRVRFAGRLVDAYVLERVDSDEGRKLAAIERVVGCEPVLTPHTSELCRAVADRYAGNFVDVARLAVPPRRAAVEAQPSVPAPPLPPPPSPSLPAGGGPSSWADYTAGPAFLAALGADRPARAVWSAAPGEDWPARIAQATRMAAVRDRGVVVVVPDARDLARLDAAMTRELGPGQHVSLSAELGPTVRYRRWLAARRGAVRVVIGTRAAAYAPVAEPGLFVVWDDGDDLHREPRAPYPDTRDVLVLRAVAAQADLLIGGFARTAEAAHLVESGWAHDIVPERGRLRERAPRVVATGDDFEAARDPGAAAARLPSLAWRSARVALQAGRPVLVQVPRAGYVPSLACARDRTPARCPNCAGPLSATSGHAISTCRWCGRPAGDWTCPVCGGRALRAVVIGSARTAEELGRAFPGIRVRSSSGDTVLAEIEPEPALVVATPGAEPVVEGGYGAALLLDGWVLLARPDLRAGEETLRRWANAAALVSPDGTVVVGADAAVPQVQALIRWDARSAAARELADRAELRFPPVSRLAALSSTPEALAEFRAGLELPPGAEILGVVPRADDQEQLLVRAPREQGGALARALHEAAAARSARKGAAVRIQMDPAELA
ncbi:MAG: primosomal protein N', partial [Actinobacteria bacterium]|nr:primosomal protein N' [Actinomycetota bacterium]